MSSEDKADAALSAKQAGPDAVKAAIDVLTPDSSDDEVEESIALCLEAKLGARALETALAAIADKSKTGIAVIRKLYKIISTKSNAKRHTKSEEKHGLEIFEFQGEYNFDDAVKACFDVLKAANEKAQRPLFSQFNGAPVRLIENNKRAGFEEMNRDELWSELNRRIAFVRKSDQAEGARQKVPEDVSKHVHAQAYANLPEVPEVLYTPAYVPSSALLLSPGYHRDDAQRVNHLVILGDLVVPPVPENPTAQNAKDSAVWILKELLSDFPFCDTGKDGIDQRGPSEANALAMLITPFMRRMIAGHTPLFMIVKPQPNSGATFLAELAMKLFGGFEGGTAPINYTRNPDDMEKKIVAAIREARSHMFFDNVSEFNNPILLAGLTATHVGGRVLGQSRNLSRENTFIWIATGINPHIGGEMHRRSCWIKLNLKKPPGEPRKYRHPNFNSFVEKNRGLAIYHILTMIEYWKSIGAPEFSDRELSSFEAWSRKVGGVLKACGVEGFLNSPAPVILDAESVSVNIFLRAMRDRWGGDFKGVTELFEWASEAELGIVTGKFDDERRQNFTEAMRKLDGRAFAHKVNEVKSNFVIRAKQDDSEGVVFGIEEVKEPIPAIPEEGA